jgi:hypothetical protein
MSSMKSVSDSMLHAGKEITGNEREKDFRAHFGGPSLAIELLWTWIISREDLPDGWGLPDLLHTLHFFKSPGENETVFCSRFHIDP